MALAEGLAPLLHWVKHLIDQVIAEEFGVGDLEFAWDQDRDADPSATATIAADYVKTGIKSINEVRAELGLPPVAGGEQPKIQTAQGLVPLTGAAPAAASAAADKLQRFNPNRYGPGPNGGQFAPSDEGGSGDGSAKPVQVADSGEVATDAAGGAAPTQVAQENDREKENDTDSNAPIRTALYNVARTKLDAIDPQNTALSPFVTAPGWSPSSEDVNGMQAALDRAIENAAANAVDHGYDKHVIQGDEFPEIGSQAQLQLLAQDVIKSGQIKTAPDGRAGFYQPSTNTLVIINTRNPTDSTIFRPPPRRQYFDQLLRQRLSR